MKFTYRRVRSALPEAGHGGYVLKLSIKSLTLEKKPADAGWFSPEDSLFKLREKFPLAFGQIGRCFNGDLNVHITVLAGPHDRHALASKAELFSGLCSFRHFNTAR